MSQPILIKIGGHEIADPTFLAELATVIKSLDVPIAIVHGGGKEISAMQEKLGIEPRYIDGVRITDAESLDVVTMMLCGLVNKRLVGTLVNHGIDAQGLSGVDRGLVRAEKMHHDSIDMGFTGEVVAVRGNALCDMLNLGVVPVIAPICAGTDNHFNVNADHVAGAVAAAINAEQVIFITNVEGVLVENKVQLSLTQAETDALIADGTIFGGMIPKVKTALHALDMGVDKAVITNLAGLKTHGGTVFIQNKEMMMQVKSDTIQNEQQYLMQNYVRPDFVLVRGEGNVLYDETGKAYQDWVAGIAVNSLGYGDKGIEKAISEQLSTGVIHLSNLYHTEPHARLAKQLVENSFADRVYFCNSGAEANEGAIKFARRVAYDSGAEGKTEVVTFTNAFHGRTMGALAVTPKDKYQAPFKPMMPGVTVAEFNNIESAKVAINANTAAVIVEPIQGEGGINPASVEFLQALRDLCDEYQAILIFDEIQCGLGRTGTLWAYESLGVTPDIMTLAKPLANGLPIGAILTTQAVADHIKPGDHGSTFAGGLLVTNVADYVVERIRQPEFLAHAKKVGEYLIERLEEINSPLIIDVRGRGLMAGMELSIEAAPVIKAGYEHGILLVNAGPNTIRFVPPLTVEKDDVDNLIDKLTTILEQVNG